MSIILALDTSIGISSVAIMREGNLLGYLENHESSRQSAQLIPLIEQALATAGVDYKELSHIAATSGPGSFTGIRIGLATASALAFGLKIPGLSFTTLEVMHQATNAQSSLAILNAGKGEVFYQYFGKAPYAPTIGTLDFALSHVPKDTLIASSIPLPDSYPSATITFPRADALAQLAYHHADCAGALIPFYIRPPDAKPQSALCSGV